MIGYPAVYLALTAVDIPAAQASIPEGVWAFLGVIVTVIAGWVTFKAISRQADRATATTQHAQERRDAVDGYDKLTAALARRVDSLDEEVQKCRDDNETLRTELANLREEMRDLARRFREGLAYIERLLDFIVNRASGAVHDVPPIPADLIDYLPASLVDTWRTPPPPADNED